MNHLLAKLAIEPLREGLPSDQLINVITELINTEIGSRTNDVIVLLTLF